MKLIDAGSYPKLSEYMKNRMPEVLQVPLIVKNMKKYGSLSKAQLRNALVWGAGPKVVVKDLSNYQCGVQWANGCFDPSNPEQIELDLTLAQDFEDDAYGAGTDRTSSGRRVFIIGTTILHELCHWGNHNASVAEADEMGIAFEVATYGRNIG